MGEVGGRMGAGFFCCRFHADSHDFRTNSTMTVYSYYFVVVCFINSTGSY